MLNVMGLFLVCPLIVPGLFWLITNLKTETGKPRKVLTAPAAVMWPFVALPHRVYSRSKYLI